jgi:hypothetical protein
MPSSATDSAHPRDRAVREALVTRGGACRGGTAGRAENAFSLNPRAYLTMADSRPLQSPPDAISLAASRLAAAQARAVTAAWSAQSDNPDISRVPASARGSRGPRVGQTLDPPVIFREPDMLFTEDGGPSRSRSKRFGESPASASPSRASPPKCAPKSGP